MSLFEKKQKKNEVKGNCTCERGTADAKDAPNKGVCCGEINEGVCCIKVLGSGCKNCYVLYENAQSAVKAIGLNVEVEYITDLQKVMEYGVMTLPALVVNGQVVSMGKVLKSAEIEKFIS